MQITVTPAELGVFLDTVASAPVALRDVPRINSILARLVGLANSRYNIGELPPLGAADAKPSTVEQSPATPAIDLVANGLPTVAVSNG